MAVLRSIESKIEGLFEGVFGRAFRTHVQPIELARKLVKEMEVESLYLFVGQAVAAHIDDQVPPIARLVGKSWRLDGPI